MPHVRGHKQSPFRRDVERFFAKPIIPGGVGLFPTPPSSLRDRGERIGDYFGSERRFTPEVPSTSRVEVPETFSPEATGRPVLPTGGYGGEVDWVSILKALEGQRPSGGGVGVDRSLFQLSETPEEAALLAREMADIEARRAAGDTALRTGWSNVQAQNQAAAEKARSMAAQSGEQAAASWSQAAQQARDLSAQRAQAAGQFAGRAGIDVDPTGGAADFIGFMESQAPAERRFAERQQEILGSDLDWMAGMAGSQGEAYAGDLQRQANVMSFERAREHNLRVQDRVAQERMTLAQMQMQAQATNAQLAARRDEFSPSARYTELLGEAASTGNPSLLANATGMSVPQAAAEIEKFWAAALRAQTIKKAGG